MKKGLFLLPLLAGFVLAGCEFTIGGKTISLGGNKENNTQQNGNGNGTGTGTGTGGNTNTGGNDSTGGNTSGDNTDGGGTTTGGGSTVSGTLLATVTMTKCQDMTSEGVFSKNGCTVEVSQGECAQTVADAVKATGNYEFRIYAKMDVTFESSTAFSKLLIKYSNYTSNGKTYYFDYEELSGATNSFDNSKYEAVVTLDSASTSFTVNCWHQTRIASVAFYA